MNEIAPSQGPAISPAAIMQFKATAEALLDKCYGLNLNDTGFCEDTYVAACIQGGARPFQCINEHAEECELGRTDIEGPWGTLASVALTEADEDAVVAALSNLAPRAASGPRP